MLGVVFFLGLITGALSNVTSGGTGAFTIFVLTKYYGGLTIQQSIGTVFAASTVMLLFGAVTFYRRGEVDKQLALTVGLPGVVGAFTAARFATMLQSALLEQAFGAFMAFLAFYASFELFQSYRRKKKTRLAATTSLDVNGGANTSTVSNVEVHSSWRGRSLPAIAVQISLGIAVGLITGLFGVGGGGLMMAALLFLFRLKTKVVLGTSLVASLFRYAGGTVGYAIASSINPFIFLVVAIGGAIGSVAGARVVTNKRTKDSYIQFVLIGVFLFISYEFLK